ncbi:MAG: hypothetical protein CMF45_00690 [Legionellales bacterium]|nr:hypothetical protein [Legionellales bacterium]
MSVDRLIILHGNIRAAFFKVILWLKIICLKLNYFQLTEVPVILFYTDQEIFNKGAPCLL